jgi:hypothetical protein
MEDHLPFVQEVRVFVGSKEGIQLSTVEDIKDDWKHTDMHLVSNDCFAHCCEAGCEFVELLGDDDLILIGSGWRAGYQAVVKHDLRAQMQEWRQVNSIDLLFDKSISQMQKQRQLSSCKIKENKPWLALWRTESSRI